MTAELARLHAEIRAKERLSTFARVAAGLAHDLQTPIESIRAACDLAVQQPESEEVRELLRSATVRHLPRLHRYVGDLRRLAQDGRIPLEIGAVDLVAVARRVIEAAASEPKWQGVELTVAGAAAPLWADESLIERAIANLVANAADACIGRSPAGRVTVRVGDAGDGRATIIEVADTGTGIAPDALADLLVNDFRSTKRNSGVGLGLAVARHIAAAHGGAIGATSDPGVGSRFRLTLPRAAVAGRNADADAGAGAATIGGRHG